MNVAERVKRGPSDEELRRILAGVEEDERVLNAEKRLGLVRGISPISAPNYFKFVRLNGASGLVIAFDHFVAQQQTRTDEDIFNVQYTNGSPIIDIFHRNMTMVTISGVLPDTAEFFSTENITSVLVGARGYIGESLELLRAIYEKNFRISAALKAPAGYVEFYHKGRVDRGYLLRFLIERSSEQLDHARFSLDMAVVRPFTLDLELPSG